MNPEPANDGQGSQVLRSTGQSRPLNAAEIARVIRQMTLTLAESDELHEAVSWAAGNMDDFDCRR